MASTPCEFLRRRLGRRTGSPERAADQPEPQQPAAVFFQGIDSGTRYQVVPNARLGAGFFAVVRHGLTDGTQTSVAIKIPSRHRFYDNSLQKEIDVLRRLKTLGQHRNIIEMVDIAWKDEHLRNPRDVVLVLQKCDCNLTKWMRTARSRIPESVPVRQEICRQLYTGLAHLHQANIVHQDLHQKNILMHGPSGMVKITDFGKARDCSPGSTHSERLTPTYMHGDILNMTVYCVIPNWLDCPMYTPLVPSHRRRFLSRGIPSELLGKSEHYLTSRALEISTSIMVGAARTTRSWENEIAKEPGLEAVMMEMHEYGLTTPISAAGVPVPKVMHSMLLVGCLVGPVNRFNAAWMAAECDGIVQVEDRERSQNVIREITVDMNSTTV
eukprot:scpid66495/ scgid17853/ Serine/threonine-protein kinase D2; nPKC-D2